MIKFILQLLLNLLKEPPIREAVAEAAANTVSKLILGEDYTSPNLRRRGRPYGTYNAYRRQRPIVHHTAQPRRQTHVSETPWGTAYVTTETPSDLDDN